MRNRLLFIICSALMYLAGFPSGPGLYAQAPYPSRVDLDFNHWYDYPEMTSALKELEKSYPEFLSLTSIGRSTGGRELWLMTMNNPETGPAGSKPAMFIDGNIHGNEIQAAEAVLYAIWYMTKSYEHIEKIREVMDRCAFYFLPMENPDGRQVWFDGPATPNYLRGGIEPVDDDHDGLFDEDPYDDLDGDGHITTMWIQDPAGRFERDPEDQRFFRRVDPDDPPGGWTPLGSEGIDNDGDGSVNEDGPGGYDPNRNWPADWQPESIQRGAGEYPFSYPETRAIGQFLIENPNIAAFQSFHNTGGMILYGPGAEYLSYPRQDQEVYRLLGAEGEKLLPFYRAMEIGKDLYTVHGGEVNFAFEILGIFGFTNELFTTKRLFNRPENPGEEEMLRFRDLLQFGDVFVPYHAVQHPDYGEVLVGGTKKYASRVTPPWMLEEDCHRNFSFLLYHADQMPLLEWGAKRVRRRDSGLWEITVEIRNRRIIPTIAEIASRNGIGNRDRLLISGSAGTEVVASGEAENFFPWSRARFEQDPEHSIIWNGDGIGSRSSRFFRMLLKGSGSVDLLYQSDKGGTIEQSIILESTREDKS